MNADRSSITVRPKEYAQMKGVHRQTIYQWIYGGILPCIKVRHGILIDPIEADQALAKFKLNKQ